MAMQDGQECSEGLLPAGRGEALSKAVPLWAPLPVPSYLAVLTTLSRMFLEMRISGLNGETANSCGLLARFSRWGNHGPAPEIHWGNTRQS